MKKLLLLLIPLLLLGQLAYDSGIRYETAIMQTTWTGGTATLPTATAIYYTSNTVNENLYSYPFFTPYFYGQSIVTCDSMFLNVYFAAVGDSMKIYLQQDNLSVVSKVDSVWVSAGSTGWRTSKNVMQNGSKVANSNYGYCLWCNCVNATTTNIRVECFVRVFYHYQK